MLLRPLLSNDDLLFDPSTNIDGGEGPDGQRSELLLVRAFVQEAHTTALLTAGVAGAVNYAQKVVTAEPLLEAGLLISNYQPNIANWPHRVLREELSFDTIQLMADLDKALQLGRSGLLDFEIDGGRIGLHRAVPLHVAKLVSLWREAAVTARALVESLREEISSIFSDEFAASADQLIKILDQVVDGKWDCCQVNGKIVLPNLDDRRRAPRHALLQAAIVRTGNMEFNAFAADISSGGVGLTRMRSLAPGTPLDIILACGRSLRGKVAWSHGENTGVVFDRPLSPTDPLIFG